MVKVLKLLKPYRIGVAGALLLMLVELSVELLQPVIMAKIIDDGILKKDLYVVLYWGAIMLGIALFAFAAGIASSFVAANVSQNYGYDLRKALFEKIQSFSFSDITRFQTSSLITRMTNDVTQVQNTVFMSLRIMLRAPLLVIGGVIMAAIVNVKLAAVLLITVPILLYFLLVILNKAGRLFRTVQEKLDKVNSVMQENLAGMKLIKAFLRRKHEASRFHEANDSLMSHTVSSLRLVEMTIPVLLLVMNITVMAILWFGSKDIVSGEVKAGEVVAIVNYATRITSVLSIFSFIIMAFSRAKASSTRIGEVLFSETEMQEGEHMERAVSEGGVSFENVAFRYPGTDVDVIRGLTVSIGAGETVAVLGATGSGKTSMLQLIPRLYDASSGVVKVDGTDVRSMTLEQLRSQIGYVPQESLLFTGAVKDNIKWGKENASMDEIITAAKDAQIHETVMKLPDQYDTKVGQKGVNLSGGQKQRLSIARALVRKPRILLLDDSTSALDLATEARLLEALEAYQCTTFIITQKISTAMRADRILLLEDGQMTAVGTHEELLDSSVLYQQIVTSQNGEEAAVYGRTSS
ncbi:ABC transporter ATP-binding protein [Fictibacillus iocasae]|uniref:ABC transporter ATP-binding protein n=1 Tax=Fictibacillus iocasae TaxID=2715437 RepID=A0ABW2NSL3_9BACL